jgi:hypothetical protein
MNTSRSCHTASVLQNGIVLVSGGVGNGSVYLSSAELYDPSTGVWTITGIMNNGRAYHTASILKNGAVLVSGGWDGSYNLKSAELYDP